MKKILLTSIVAILIFGLVYSSISGILPILFGSNQETFDVEKALEQKWDSGIPDAWLAKHGIVVRNEIDIKIDHDNDGLDVLAEYQYKTDPHNSDTDADGYEDGREVTNGYSPSGPGLLDQNSNDVSDIWEIKYFGKELAGSEDDHDNDGLDLYEEFLYGTDPTKKDTDGDGYDDFREIGNGYDPTMSGDARISMTIKIKKINIEAPIVISKSSDEKLIQKDLEKGVILYPEMAMPGERGNAYIAGHSSNYVWSKGSYNYVFAHLNDVVRGDEIEIIQELQNGKKVSLKYIIDLKEEVLADDERIFADTHAQELTLTTCWPIGTNARRLMVKAYLQDA